MKVICSKYSRSRSRTDRRSFSKSSSARGQKVSAKAISKRYSKHWSENRKHEEICKGGSICRITKNLAKFRENITSGSIATAQCRLTKAKVSPMSTSSLRKDSTKLIRSCTTSVRPLACATLS